MGEGQLLPASATVVSARPPRRGPGASKEPFARARLDALPLDTDEKAAMLREVKDVFALNGALFTELSGTVVRS